MALSDLLLLTLVAALPVLAGSPGTFEIVGDTGVNAHAMFLGQNSKLYIVDRTEANPLKVVSNVTGAPSVWASEFDLESRKATAMVLKSNTFCSGGSGLGDGRWFNTGGNAGQGQGSTNGLKGTRFLTPGGQWEDIENGLNDARWYPTVETLPNGDAIIIGGSTTGDFVNAASRNNPTYEFYPRKGGNVPLDLLKETLPVNLYPITFLLPSGKLLIQAGQKTITLDPTSGQTQPLPDVPDALRCYPASSGSVMLPLTPANNYTGTVLLCGGVNPSDPTWNNQGPNAKWIIETVPSKSCVTISPDVADSWANTDDLQEGRTMGMFVNLPDGRLFFTGGAHHGTAGYNVNGASWIPGESYGDDPAYDSWYYDPAAPAGQRWTKAGTTTIPRMYHSSATLLPDGTVAIAGSNPNDGFRTPENVNKTRNYKYYTELRIEYFTPDYAARRKPTYLGTLPRLTYGGNFFSLNIGAEDYFNDAEKLKSAKAVVSRTGYSTHGLNMGQRHVELPLSYAVKADGSAEIFVGQLPPNAAVMPPGVALFFLVIDGVPSQGAFVNIGSGKIEAQPTLAVQALPNTVTTPAAVNTTTAVPPSSSETVSVPPASSTASVPPDSSTAPPPTSPPSTAPPSESPSAPPLTTDTSVPPATTDTPPTSDPAPTTSIPTTPTPTTPTPPIPTTSMPTSVIPTATPTTQPTSTSTIPWNPFQGTGNGHQGGGFGGGLGGGGRGWVVGGGGGGGWVGGNRGWVRGGFEHGGWVGGGWGGGMGGWSSRGHRRQAPEAEPASGK